MVQNLRLKGFVLREQEKLVCCSVYAWYYHKLNSILAAKYHLSNAVSVDVQYKHIIIFMHFHFCTSSVTIPCDQHPLSQQEAAPPPSQWYCWYSIS